MFPYCIFRICCFVSNAACFFVLVLNAQRCHTLILFSKLSPVTGFLRLSSFLLLRKFSSLCQAFFLYQRFFGIYLWAPRIISNLQGRCGHEKAAEEAAEQENLISTIDEIV